MLAFFCSRLGREELSETTKTVLGSNHRSLICCNSIDEILKDSEAREEHDGQGDDTCLLHPFSDKVPSCYYTFRLNILSIYFKQFAEITCRSPLCLSLGTTHSLYRSLLCYLAARKKRRNLWPAPPKYSPFFSLTNSVKSIIESFRCKYLASSLRKETG